MHDTKKDAHLLEVPYLQRLEDFNQNNERIDQRDP